jgi:ABC-2 type transport system ATP-binding protein
MTTHYMDEAERCHRLAFIFSGVLLDTGTPDEIVERRHLRIAEIDVDRATEAADLLRAHRDVDEVSHFGSTLRVATRNGVDPEAFSRVLLGEHGITVRRTRPGRTTVEDAFVSMVRAEELRKRGLS